MKIGTPTQRSGILAVGIAVLLSTFALQASDVARYGTSSLVGSVGSAQGECPAGTIGHQIDDTTICIDAYEASASYGCMHPNPTRAQQHTANVGQSDCAAQSVAGASPLRSVTYTHAERYCTHAGKRLLTPREWYVAARSVTDQSSCVVNAPSDGARPTGSVACTNEHGVHDLVGNVWEWVDAEITAGTYKGRSLPETGYVAGVDTSGVVVHTTSTPVALYDDAYAWTAVDDTTVYGMIRGGFYGSRSDAGRYAQNVEVPLDYATAGIGFRCATDRS